MPTGTLGARRGRVGPLSLSFPYQTRPQPSSLRSTEPGTWRKGWGLEGFPEPGAEPRAPAAAGAASWAAPQPRGLLRVWIPDRSCPASSPREKKASLSRPGGAGQGWGGGATVAS